MLTWPVSRKSHLSNFFCHINWKKTAYLSRTGSVIFNWELISAKGRILRFREKF